MLSEKDCSLATQLKPSAAEKVKQETKTDKQLGKDERTEKEKPAD